MRPAGGKSNLASYALVAAAGAGAMVGLVCLINVDTSKPRRHAPAVHKHVTPLPPPAPHVDRWAFAPSHVFAAVPELRPGFAPEVDIAEAETNRADLHEAEPNEADPSQAPEAVASGGAGTVEHPWETDAHSTPVTRTAHHEQSDKDEPTPRRRRPYSRSLEKRLAEISPGATARLKKKFEDARVAWPPSEIALIGIKDEKILELHARSKGQPWQLIHRYPILAASGSMGPKLRQGDKQVPEGIYRIAWLNPNSAYHVSLRVSYPNAFDRKMAKKEGRSNLGGDIMIHGKNLSAGCLAIGDKAVEEIFTVAAETGLAKVRVIIAPTDLRTKAIPQPKPGQPEWVPKLYTEIASAMSGYESVSPIATSSTNIASSFMSFFAK